MDVYSRRVFPLTILFLIPDATHTASVQITIGIKNRIKNKNKINRLPFPRPAAVLALTALTFTARAQRPPNVIFILTDPQYDVWKTGRSKAGALK